MKLQHMIGREGDKTNINICHYSIIFIIQTDYSNPPDKAVYFLTHSLFTLTNNSVVIWMN
jgi:hypothetical protein